jgi:hypothetical protein
MFGYRAVAEKVPNAASGVYAILAPRRVVYVGESNDIRRSLFRHLNNEDTGMTRFGALSFSFELVPSADRLARKQLLVATLKPSCN